MCRRCLGGTRDCSVGFSSFRMGVRPPCPGMFTVQSLGHNFYSRPARELLPCRRPSRDPAPLRAPTSDSCRRRGSCPGRDLPVRFGHRRGPPPAPRGRLPCVSSQAVLSGFCPAPAPAAGSVAVKQQQFKHPLCCSVPSGGKTGFPETRRTGWRASRPSSHGPFLSHDAVSNCRHQERPHVFLVSMPLYSHLEA